MISYLPLFLREVTEFRALLQSASVEINQLQDGSQAVIDDAFILTASETRITAWEKALGVVPAGNLAQRKSYIISCLRGQGKLSEESIKHIVDAFTGGEATINLIGSVLIVKILAPALGDVYLFPDVERALRPRVPAHLGLQVQKFYSTWGDIRNDYSSWNTVYGLTDWNALKNYVP